MIILPHGGWALIPATLATMAWMTALSLDGCDYARLTGPAVTTLTKSSIYPYVEIGFNTYRIPSFYSNYQSWEVRFNDPRIPYGEVELTKYENGEEGGSSKDTRYDMDQSIDMLNPTHGIFWNVGSMSHKMGIVFGGSAALFLWVPCLCLSYSERIWRIGGIKLILAAFFHLFSLVWFLNSLCLERASKCHWHYGSFASLISCVLYTLSFWCVFLRYPKPIVVRLVQERIEKEFQRYQRNRPDLNANVYDSRRTTCTEIDDTNSAGSSHQSSDQQRFIGSAPSSALLKNVTSRRLVP